MSKNKFSIKKTTRSDFITYLMVAVAFVIVVLLMNGGKMTNQQIGWLIPVCCYVTMALSLNLTVGILGELSLGHAGFMSVGAFSGIIAWTSFAEVIPSIVVRLIVSMIIGAIIGGIFGFLIGIPVLRLKGDYLAIVTLAFGEIIKDIINCLYVGVDSKGLHVVFSAITDKTAADLHLEEGGKVIINGALGITGTKLPASEFAAQLRDAGLKSSAAKQKASLYMFIVGFILIMVTLVIVLNFIRSRTGRAVMAIRDNRIAAESVGINVMRHKMTAFVLSSALAGAAGTLFAMNMPTLQSDKFDFDTSILILVFVVLGGLGNMRGSIIAAALLYILPEMLRQFSTYRMLIYAIILILVMLATNNPVLKDLVRKVVSPITNLFKKKKQTPVTENEGGANNE